MRISNFLGTISLTRARELSVVIHYQSWFSASISVNIQKDLDKENAIPMFANPFA